MADNEDIGGVSIGVNVDLGQLEEQFAKAEAICKASGQNMGDAIAGAFDKGADSVASAVQQIISAAESEQAALQRLGGAATEAASQLSLFDDAAHIDFSDATGQLNLFATMLEPIAATTQQAAKGIAEFGSAADLAARPIGSTVVASNELAESANKAADAGKNAGSSWEGFGSTLLGLAGISFTIGALKELVVGSIEVADKIGDTEQSLTRLTGSAEQAAEMMKRLRSLADDDGLSFPSLLTAVTRLQTLLPTGADVVGVMGELANVSETLGTSIEAAGQKFSTIVDSGNASTKALSQLGLTMGDITKAMEELGISAEKSFKELSQGERFDVLTTALKKFDGAAKELNDDIGGDWTRAMNAAKDAMKNLGDAIGDGEHKFSIFSTTVKVVEGVTLSLVAGLKVLFDTIKFVGAEVTAVIAGLAKTLMDTFAGVDNAIKGNFSAAFEAFKTVGQDVTRTFDTIKQAGTLAWDSITKDFTAGTAALDKAFSTTKTGADAAATGVAHLGDTFDAATGKAKVHAEHITVLAKATHDFVDISKAAAAGMLDFQTATERAWDKVGLLVASQERVNEQLAVAKARFDAGQISAAEYSKAVDLVKKVNDELVKSLDAINKIAKEIADAAWAKQMNEAALAAMDIGNNLKTLGAFAAPVAPIMSELNRAMSDFGIQTGKAKIPVEELKTDIGYLSSEFAVLISAAEKSGDWSGFITALDNVDKRIAQIAKVDLPEAAVQLEIVIQKMINMGAPTELVQAQLIKLEAIVDKMGKEGFPQAAAAMQAYLNLLKQVPSAVNDIISKQENQIQNDQKSLSLLMQRKDAIGAVLEVQKQLYTEEIRLGELQGKNVEGAIYGLEKTKLGLESNRIATHGLADEYVKMIEIVNKGFDAIGKSIADCIIDQKNFGEAMIATLKNIAKEILETVIEGALLPLKKELIDLEKKWLDSITNTTKGVKDLTGAADEAAKAQKSLGSAATAAAQAVSQLASTISIITGIISAGAAVASTIILTHISSDTGHIEVNTRGQLAEALNLRTDLWSQFNQNFTRFGEMKNALDAIAASVKTLSQAAPAVVAANTQSALEKIASTADSQLAQQASIADSAKWSLAALNLISGDVAAIRDTLAYAIHDDLAGVNQRLDAVIGALLYGNNTNRENSQQSMDSFSDLEDAVMSAKSAIARGFDDVVGGINEADSSRHNDDSSGYARQVAGLERIVAANTAAAASSHDAVTAIGFLQKALVAEQQLAILAQQANDIGMANQYRSGADNIAQQIRSLDGHTVSSTMSILGQMVASDKSGAAYITGAATNIVVAIGNAANQISSSVYAAGALTAQQLADLAARTAAIGGGQTSGGGTNTYIPRNAPPSNVPSEESQRPGNSNSPTGNTGQTGGAPANGGGGYIIPIQTGNSAPSTSTTMRNADGTITEGNYVPQKNQVPFDPLNPFTWSNDMTQAQRDAINNAHVPSYDQGGMVPQDMLSLVHKDEMVLPPDLSQMLKRMVSTPSTPGSYPTYAGSQGVSSVGGGTVINMPITNNGVTSSRELMQLWTQELKRIIPRATVFSS